MKPSMWLSSHIKYPYHLVMMMHVIENHPIDRFYNSLIFDEIINLEYKKSQNTEFYKFVSTYFELKQN